LTYSIAVPRQHPLGRRAADLYRIVHEAIVEVLTQLRVAARLHEGGPTNEEPFLCFMRRCIGDVMIDQWKVAGSAQRRHRAAVLQHGSILLDRSAMAPELPGINDLVGPKIDQGEFACRLQDALRQPLGPDFTHNEPPTVVLAEAAAIEVAKFGTQRWLWLR
jgi:lipoyl(octanoyl) transferase